MRRNPLQGSCLSIDLAWRSGVQIEVPTPLVSGWPRGIDGETHRRRRLKTFRGAPSLDQEW